MTQVLPSCLLLVGKVIGLHGLGGLLRIQSYARSEASFLDAGTVFLRSPSGEIDEYAVKEVKPYKKVFLMKLDSLTDGDDAAKYSDADIFISKAAVASREDEYFWYELLGLKVYLDTGQYVGVISQIIATGANDIYVVKKAGKEIYIPAIYEVVKEIDIKSMKMVVSPMEGLLELNEV